MAINKKTREAVYQKYGGRCAYCGRAIAYKDMQVDHFRPLRVWNEADGAADDISKCPRCGGRIVVSILCQYTMDFLVKKDGTLSKKHKKIDNGPVGSTIACCENSENCGTYWEENDFDLENGDKFIDMKYSDEE